MGTGKHIKLVEVTSPEGVVRYGTSTNDNCCASFPYYINNGSVMFKKLTGRDEFEAYVPIKDQKGFGSVLTFDHCPKCGKKIYFTVNLTLQEKIIQEMT